MKPTEEYGPRQAAALGLLRRLRDVDHHVGVKNSRIAFDIALLFYEGAGAPQPASLSVDQIAALTQYSGPTVRLVLKRLIDGGTITLGRRVGKTQLYEMTVTGRAAFEGYISAVLEFRAP
jgi:hypothetical protein